jgi:hypothetical protein
VYHSSTFFTAFLRLPLSSLHLPQCSNIILTMYHYPTLMLTTPCRKHALFSHFRVAFLHFASSPPRSDLPTTPSKTQPRTAPVTLHDSSSKVLLTTSRLWTLGHFAASKLQPISNIELTSDGSSPILSTKDGMVVRVFQLRPYNFHSSSQGVDSRFKIYRSGVLSFTSTNENKTNRK